MKTLFKLMLATAAAAVTFAACQRETSPAADGEQTVRFVAESAPTRTAFTTPDGDGQYPVLWTENDTKVKVSMNLASAKDADVTPASDGQSAKFEAQFSTDGVTAPYTFYALSPATAGVSISSQYKSWTIQIPADQTPGFGTPDEAAQILAGVSEDYTSLDEVIGVNFSHVTAYGRLTLTNLDLTGVAVNGISLDFGTPVAGRFFYYVADTDDHAAGELAENSASNIINLATSQTREVWFACAPADISGKELKVTVNTAGGLLEKTITVPANRRFVSGRIAKFSIDMTGATLQDNKVYELVTDAAELTAGSEIIIANAAGDQAISTTQNTNNRAATAVTVADNTITNPSGSVEILTVEAGTASGTVAFKGQNDLYLVSESGNNRLKSSEEKTALGSFTVTIDAAGATKVIATASDRGDMRFNENNGNPIFNCYATTSTTGTPVALYKLVGSGTDEPVFQATLEGADESGHLEVPATTTSVTINVIANVDWEISSNDDVEFSQESGNSSAAVEVTFGENDTDEEIVYTINIESELGDEFEFVITQEAFVPAGESVYRKVTSVTAGKKYILAALVDGKVQAMTPIASGTAYGYPAGTKVSETDGVIDTRHTELELTFTAVTGGYSIQQPDNRYWAMTGTYNSINVYDSAQESYIWTVTANSDGTVDVVNAGKNKHVVYNVSRSYFAVYETVNESNIYPSLYEYIDGGDTPPEPPVGEEEYSFTITKDDFNGTSYAANNGDHTSTARSKSGATMEVTWKSTQVMQANSTMQWKKKEGCIESVTNLGTVVSVDIVSTAGEFTKVISGGTFKISVGDAIGKTDAVTVTFKTDGSTPPVVETAATPTFSPAAGEVEAGTVVTIACATEGADIYYTTDGSTPTTSSTKGTSVTVNAAMTIKAIAVKEGMNDSAVAEAAYTVKSTTPPSGDNYVKVSSITSGKKYIIVAGTRSRAMNPGQSVNGRLGSTEVEVNSGVIASTTATDALAVTITEDVAGTGTDPIYLIQYNSKYIQWKGSGTELSSVATASDNWTVSAGTTATGTFRFTATTSMSQSTVRALAFRSGDANNVFGAYSTSNITGNDYFDIDLYEFGGETVPIVETVATPVFSPAEGAVNEGTVVTISCATAGATIHYTTDGTTPTASSTAGTSVTVNSAMTIKAIAVKEGMNDSAVATANYTIRTPGTLAWSRVTSVSDLEAGDQVIIVSEGDSKVGGPISGTNKYLSAESVTVSDHEISNQGNAEIFILGKSGSNWTLTTADGRALGATAAKSLAYDNGTTTWTISIDSDGNATIASTNESYGRILYNVSSPRFMNYTSGTTATMKLPQIYKN